MRGVSRSRSAALSCALAGGGLALWAPSALASTVSAGDVRVAETDAATTATFTITRVADPLSLPLSVSYATVDGTATAPADYAKTAGMVSFPAAPLGDIQTATVTVGVVGDDLTEGDEVFRLRLSGSAEISSPLATATIVDDDPAPATGGGGGGGGGGSPTAPGTPLAPVSPFGLGAPRLQRPATVLVSTGCPVAARTCKGTLSVRTRPVTRTKIPALRKARTLGKRPLSLTGGQTRTMRLKLKATDRALLERAGRMSVVATTRITDAAGRTTKRTVNGRLIARTEHSG